MKIAYISDNERKSIFSIVDREYQEAIFQIDQSILALEEEKLKLQEPIMKTKKLVLNKKKY